MWNDSFIKNMSQDDIVVYGSDNEEQRIKRGEFLDICSTIIYKQEQIKSVANLFNEDRISNGDVFFVPDIFYPALASIRYMADLLGIDVKIVSFNHAGRADEHDFVQKLGSWADTQEDAWHKMCDVVLVGSQYHKQRVEKKFNVNNVKVTGAVWSKEWMDDFCKDINRKKSDYIIYPHRPCKEKRFDLFLEVARKNPLLKFLITSSGDNRLEGVELPNNVTYWYNLSKREYYQAFAHADGYLSTAYQETFGYTLQEAIYFNCKVIVPDYACYREFADESSIVSFNDMITDGYLTEKFKTGDLSKSTQHRDNASEIYNLCKKLR